MQQRAFVWVEPNEMVQIPALGIHTLNKTIWPWHQVTETNDKMQRQYAWLTLAQFWIVSKASPCRPNKFGCFARGSPGMLQKSLNRKGNQIFSSERGCDFQGLHRLRLTAANCDDHRIRTPTFRKIQDNGGKDGCWDFFRRIIVDSILFLVRLWLIFGDFELSTIENALFLGFAILSAFATQRQCMPRTFSQRGFRQVSDLVLRWIEGSDKITRRSDCRSSFIGRFTLGVSFVLDLRQGWAAVLLFCCTDLADSADQPFVSRFFDEGEFKMGLAPVRRNHTPVAAHSKYSSEALLFEQLTLLGRYWRNDS